MTNSTVSTDYAPVVVKLQNILAGNSELEDALVSSIKTASQQAKKDLSPQLYAGLNKVFNQNGWPETLDAYYNYLDQYVKLVPNEEIYSEYPDAWKSTPTSNGVNRKVYDLLCQFYWLINQKGSNGVTVQTYPEFAAWLVEFAESWGEYCSTPESWTKPVRDSFENNKMYNWDWYSDNKDNWTSFNEFFYREFNGADAKTGISPLRPITAPSDNKTIVAPADCTFKMDYPIDENGHVTDKNGVISTITLKHTHEVNSIDQLLDGSKYADAFKGGTFVHYFLGPFDYHRFHTPVSGYVLESRAIQGKVYLNVNITENQFDAPDGATDGYEFSQARGLVVMDTVELGKVAILPIGMCQVSGVLMNTELQGQDVIKGQEFGKFQFGGSDIIMLFEKSPEDLYFFKEDPGHNPIHFQYGQAAIIAK